MDKLLCPSRILLTRFSALILIFLLLSACGPIAAGTPTPQDESPNRDDLQAPTAELIPIEQVTDVPDHAETVTPQPEAVETSIQPNPAIEINPPAIPPDADLEALLGAEQTFEEADLLIKRPGQLSRIVSPFRVIAFVEPGPDNLVQVRLLGEDGRTLAEKKVRVMEYLGLDNGNMITDLEFEIEALSELGRVEVSVTDEFGRVKAYNSVDIILLSVGQSDRNYTPEHQERVVIQYPFAGFAAEGSTLLVTGLVRTSSNEPLGLTLTNESGSLVGEASASVVLSEEKGFGLFIGEIPYQVDSPTWIRLSIYVPGDRIPGIEFIKTMQLIISP